MAGEAPELLGALVLLGALGVLFWLLFDPWQTLCVDWARQLLFEVRDDLFDLAADGRIAFDDPLYRRIRGETEGLIRYAHHVTWLRLIVLHQAGAGQTAAGTRSVRSLIGDLPHGDLRTRLESLITRRTVVLVLLMVARNPLCWPFVAVAALLQWLGLFTVRARRTLTEIAEPLSATAVDGDRLGTVG